MGEGVVYLRSFLTSSHDGGGWSNSGPGRFTPEEEPRCSVNRRLDGLQRRCELFRRRENLVPLPEFEPRTVRPVESRYTDRAVQDTHHVLAKYKLCTSFRVVAVLTDDL
jgi:hypothetical protein